MRALGCLVLLCLLAGCTTVPTGPVEPKADAKSRAAVHTQLALGYLQRGQKRTALNEIDKALKIEPSYPQANYVMAMLQTELSHRDKADEYYRKALAADPQYSTAAHDYAIFLCKGGKVEEAMSYFKSALDNPLYDRKTLTNLRAGECLMDMRTDRRDAEPYFAAALKADPKLAPALFYMADISYARNDFLQARAYIERYFAVGPDTAASLLLAVRIESHLKANQTARRYAARLMEKFATSDEAKQLKMYQ
ncbi:MAG: type IV pilus biogenesis/stability protein PilW [Arenicellales bacterium]